MVRTSNKQADSKIWNLADFEEQTYRLPKQHGVYLITCLPTNKQYVGSAAGYNGFRGRIRLHLYNLRAGNHHAPYLQHSFNKYGIAAFTVTLIEVTTPANAVAAEQVWLDRLGTFRPTHGFNCSPTAGSCLGIQGKKGNRPWLGKKHTPETIEKMRKAATGRTLSPEIRAKISAAHQGKKHTPEHIAKVVAAGRGRKWSAAQHASKKAELSIPYRLEKDGVIYEGVGIKAFCQERNLNDAAIGAVLLGRRASSKGYRIPGVAPIKYPEYDLISPTGEIHHVTNLNAFCREHGISQGNMWMTLKRGRGVCQGWRAA